MQAQTQTAQQTDAQKLAEMANKEFTFSDEMKALWEREKETAKIILHQLGGRRFQIMTGSKDFIAFTNDKGHHGLRMNLTKNNSGANRLSITLNYKDLYDVRFFSQRKQNKYLIDEEGNYILMGNKKVKYGHSTTEKEIKVFNDIYCDQLTEIFERVTGLYTSL